jgi:hypothetical protein
LERRLAKWIQEIYLSIASLDKPEFPGGINKFYSYLVILKKEIDGSGSIRVYVSFVLKGTAA